MSDSRFLQGKQLQPGDVFYAIAGVFVKAKYELVERIADEYAQQPDALVFRSPDESERLHILYYPAKDNDTAGKDVPLKTILARVQKKLLTSDTKLAIEHFIIEESNSLKLLGLPIKQAAHYVAALRENNCLTIEDSIKRAVVEYDTTYIQEAIKSNKAFMEVTGQQHDHWACGHFVIEAHRRKIEDREFNTDFRITNEVLAEHKQLMASGLSLRQSDPAIESSEDFSMSEDDISQVSSAKLPAATKPAIANNAQQQHIMAYNILMGAAIGTILLLAVIAVLGIGILTGGFGIPALAGLAITIAATLTTLQATFGSILTGLVIAGVPAITGALFGTIGGILYDTLQPAAMNKNDLKTPPETKNQMIERVLTSNPPKTKTLKRSQSFDKLTACQATHFQSNNGKDNSVAASNSTTHSFREQRRNSF